MIKKSPDAATPTAVYVRDLARRMGVVFEPTVADRWAADVTRLSGDEVKSDFTDGLLVALRQSGKITPSEFAAFVMAHHHERQQG